MLSIFLVLSIGFGVAFKVKALKTSAHDFFDNISIVCFVVTAFVGSILAVVCAVLAMATSATRKEVLYTEENLRIEAQMYAIVQEYLDHEKATYEALNPETAIALITVYPELQSVEIVKEFVEVYNANKARLLRAKEAKIDVEVMKWWVYFGGI